MRRPPRDDERCTGTVYARCQDCGRRVSKQLDGVCENCGGTNVASDRCQAFAMLGTNVCSKHGGMARQVKTAGRRRFAEKQAAQTLHEQGVEPIGDPLVAFQRLVEETVALKDFFAGRVAELRDQVRYESSVTGTEQLRAEVAIYERAADRAGRFLTDWVRLGIDERIAKAQVRLAKAQADLLEQVMRNVFTDPQVGMTAQQQEAAQRAFGRHLRAVVAAS